MCGALYLKMEIIQRNKTWLAFVSDSVLPLVAQMRIILSIEVRNTMQFYKNCLHSDRLTHATTLWLGMFNILNEKRAKRKEKKKIIHKIQYNCSTQRTRLSIEWFKTVDVGCDRAAWQPTIRPIFLLFIKQNVFFENFCRRWLFLTQFSNTKFEAYTTTTISKWAAKQ